MNNAITHPYLPFANSHRFPLLNLVYILYVTNKPFEFLRHASPADKDAFLRAYNVDPESPAGYLIKQPPHGAGPIEPNTFAEFRAALQEEFELVAEDLPVDRNPHDLGPFPFVLSENYRLLNLFVQYLCEPHVTHQLRTSFDATLIKYEIHGRRVRDRLVGLQAPNWRPSTNDTLFALIAREMLDDPCWW